MECHIELLWRREALGRERLFSPLLEEVWEKFLSLAGKQEQQVLVSVFLLCGSMAYSFSELITVYALGWWACINDTLYLTDMADVSIRRWHIL